MSLIVAFGVVTSLALLYYVAFAAEGKIYTRMFIVGS